ncbi:MAG TPA: hypothetical protein VL069_04670 [Opitutus sp.]|nr:hypothetical protein [Opitutus sp.]
MKLPLPPSVVTYLTKDSAFTKAFFFSTTNCMDAASASPIYHA